MRSTIAGAEVEEKAGAHDAEPADILASDAGAGFAPKIAIEVENMLSNIALVAAGVGVSAVPESMRDIHSRDVAYFRAKEANKLVAPLTLASRSDATNPAAGRFLTFADSISRQKTRETAN